MDVGFLVDKGPQLPDRDFIVWRDRGRSYRWLADEIGRWRAVLECHGIARGEVVAIESDFSPTTAALLLALLERDAITVPVRRDAAEPAKAMIRSTAPVERWFTADPRDGAAVEASAGRAEPHPLIAELRARAHPGLILFTSGSSGRPKAVLHDARGLLARFERPQSPRRLLAFLLFDHLGGLNTLFHALGGGGTLVTAANRNPDTICAAIARHRVEVLPVSPTFLQLMLVSGAHERHDLTSLRMITYGAEPMPQSTLARLRTALPDVKLKQTYGLIEVGAFPSQSRAPDSLWVRLAVEHRVVDGILQLKTPAAMLGYLNAPSPFTADGWFVTGDLAEQDGEYLRIAGRASELINVGGEKVLPQEVEAVIQELAAICDVEVYAEPHGLVGSVVCARIAVESGDAREVARAVKQHCRRRLERHKVPVKVVVTSELPDATPIKRLRRRAADREGAWRS